jgi:hypothetical protein
MAFTIGSMDGGSGILQLATCHALAELATISGPCAKEKDPSCPLRGAARIQALNPPCALNSCFNNTMQMYMRRGRVIRCVPSDLQDFMDRNDQIAPLQLQV